MPDIAYQGPLKYDHFTRISIDKNKEIEKGCPLKISIQTLDIFSGQPFSSFFPINWSHFVDGLFTNSDINTSRHLEWNSLFGAEISTIAILLIFNSRTQQAKNQPLIAINKTINSYLERFLMMSENKNKCVDIYIAPKKFHFLDVKHQLFPSFSNLFFSKN